MTLFERRCEHCGEKMINPRARQKYHLECSTIVSRARSLEYYHKAKSGTETIIPRSKYSELFDVLERIDDPYIHLAMAIIARAYIDWKELCDGATLKDGCNFEELEDFFKNNCDWLLKGTSFRGKDLLKILQEERASAGL
jgi:hypothetical protein